MISRSWDCLSLAFVQPPSPTQGNLPTGDSRYHPGSMQDWGGGGL